MFKIFLFLGIFIFPFQCMAIDNAPLLNSYYATIVEKHAEPITVEKLAVNSLAGLSDVDKNLLFANGKEMVYLYYKRHQVALWHKPLDKNDIDVWSDLSDKVIKAAIKYSPKASIEDYNVVEKVMTAGARSLEDHSYYQFDRNVEKEDDYKPMRHFGRRMFQDILYIKVGSFSASTPKNVKKALKDYPEAQAIILDLRGNRGGLLTSAIDTAGLFIDGGIITSVRGRDTKKIKYYNSLDKEVLNLPMVVMIDKNTASSAEVVAAALSEQTQAKLLGTNSFGKGSIQEMYQFENEGKLALTTAHFYTPSDKKIDKIGLVPDYCTYQADENTLYESITSGHHKNCQKEERENRKFDLNFAIWLIKNGLFLQ